MRGVRLAVALWLLPAIVRPAVAETVVIEASRDATLIEDTAGALANGSGRSLFAGRTNQNVGSVRRALLYFDVTSAVPRGAVVESVSLTLYMTPSNAQPAEMLLHRVQAGWGEGPSSSGGGAGATAGPGDATWVHRIYDDAFWVRVGGQFVGRVSASLTVANPGFHTWESTNHLVQDVRLWLANPRRNFGWILLGDENARQTVKSFASREDPLLALRPALEVTYRLPPGRR